MKKLAITAGDPGGIGPEIIVRALASGEPYRHCIPVVIGDPGIMQEAASLADLPVTINEIRSPSEAATSKDVVNLISPGNPQVFIKCRPSKGGGEACAGYIRKAVELAMNRKVDGVVTAPISKEALKMAGFSWPGHTEMIAELTGTTDYAMMLTGGPLKVILATIHTSLRSVPDLITRARVLRTVRLAKRACEMFGIRQPKIVVAGLNPHAGESGIFGDEELSEILPAVEDALREGIPVSGPFPPDTIFNKAYKGEVDIVVCMYHDQGLIPLKMIAFDKGVNVTVGLPIIRTSPDHGTAYDIAWQGKADPSSMIEAIKFASMLKI